MKTFITISLVWFVTACKTSGKYSETKYDDKLIHKSEKIDGAYTREFIRHDLTYLDKVKNHRLIERSVYDDDKLIYRYPILQSNLPKSNLKLLSGNNYLTKGFIDTILISNKALPIMNRTVYVKGALVSMTSDSTYLIKIKDSASTKATFFVTASDNYEEISGRNSFISDSLIIHIK